MKQGEKSWQKKELHLERQLAEAKNAHLHVVKPLLAEELARASS